MPIKGHQNYAEEPNSCPSSEQWWVWHILVLETWKAFPTNSSFHSNHNPPPLVWLKCPFSAIKKATRRIWDFIFLTEFHNIWEEATNKMKTLHFCGGSRRNRPPCTRKFPPLHLVFLWRAATHCSYSHGRIQPPPLRRDEQEEWQDFWKLTTPLLPSRLLIPANWSLKWLRASRQQHSNKCAEIQ